MKLRRPEEQLAGCVWLPRFIDKCRHHFAGTLAEEYQLPFCNPMSTDGIFLTHFGLEKDEMLAAIRAAESDDAIANWFVGHVGDARGRIGEWNRIAPNIGRPGSPGERAFRWARMHLYRDCRDPRVTSVFTAIAWDEGYLDELCLPAPAASTLSSCSSTNRLNHDPYHPGL